MSCTDWSRDHHFEICCDRPGCGTLLSEVPTLHQAFAAMIEDRDGCRPCVVTILRRGRTPAKKRWKWPVWLYREPRDDQAA